MRLYTSLVSETEVEKFASKLIRILWPKNEFYDRFFYQAAWAVAKTTIPLIKKQLQLSKAYIIIIMQLTEVVQFQTVLIFRNNQGLHIIMIQYDEESPHKLEQRDVMMV